MQLFKFYVRGSVIINDANLIIVNFLKNQRQRLLRAIKRNYFRQKHVFFLTIIYIYFSHRAKQNLLVGTDFYKRDAREKNTLFL